MTTRDKVARIVVGTDFGPRSGVWRIYAHNDDIYVQHYGMRADFKTSLHASGLNRHAMTESGASRWIPDRDRAFFKWGEPDEFDVGGRILLEIVIPSDHLTVPSDEPPETEKQKITLFDPAPPGHATFISVVITRPGTRLTAPDDFPSILVASWATPSRGTISIVVSDQPYHDTFRKAVEVALPQITEQLAEQIGEGPLPENADRQRLVFWLDTDRAGVARIIEVGVSMGRR